jgi:hypothetical protein
LQNKVAEYKAAERGDPRKGLQTKRFFDHQQSAAVKGGMLPQDLKTAIS